MTLYRTGDGVVVQPRDEDARRVDTGWDELLRAPSLASIARRAYDGGEAVDTVQPDAMLVPLVSQEVWAAGVTYYRSRDARMAESADAGGGSFYDRVYEAERPELFFKANARTVVGTGERIAIRSDATWSVPEPELVLLANPDGVLTGYTVGNDVSSRDIEGENPLYLPQAKVYDRSCAIGPGVLVADDPLPAATSISMRITRQGRQEFAGSTKLSELKRTAEELLGYLYRHNAFADGCYLMTGTGIVPPDGFTLASGDEVTIAIDGVGELSNVVD